MLGTFSLEMKGGYHYTTIPYNTTTNTIPFLGLTGFARLTKGDTFEVSMRYGPKQKWKCKGKVGSFKQSWKNEKTTLRSLISHVFSIKVLLSLYFIPASSSSSSSSFILLNHSNIFNNIYILYNSIYFIVFQLNIIIQYTQLICIYKYNIH